MNCAECQQPLFEGKSFCLNCGHVNEFTKVSSGITDRDESTSRYTNQRAQVIENNNDNNEKLINNLHEAKIAGSIFIGLVGMGIGAQDAGGLLTLFIGLAVGAFVGWFLGGFIFSFIRKGRA